MIEKDGLEIKITHPDGMEMRFSESITRYLMERRDKASQFFFSDWVGSLSDDLLAQLVKLVERLSLSDEEIRFDDLLQAMVIAVAIESKVQTVEVSEEKLDRWISQVAKISSAEMLKRSGALKVSEPMGISIKTDINVEMTDLGMKYAEELRKKMN